MTFPTDIHSFIVNGFQGLIEGLGNPSPQVTLVDRPDGQGTIALIRDGYEIKTLEGLRTQARQHTFEDLGSLAEWLNKHADPSLSEVLVGEKDVRVALTPRDVHGDIVTCSLALHPRFARWFGLLNRELSQRQLQRHILGALEDFDVDPESGVSAGELLAMQLQKFEAVKTAEVRVEIDERGMTTFAGATEKTEIKGRLPAKFKIRVPMFIGVEDVTAPLDRELGSAVQTRPECVYELELFLGVEPQAGKHPTFSLESPKLPVVRREARLDSVAWLRHLLAEKQFLVGLGEIKLQNVPVVQPQ